MWPVFICFNIMRIPTEIIYCKSLKYLLSITTESNIKHRKCPIFTFDTMSRRYVSYKNGYNIIGCESTLRKLLNFIDNFLKSYLFLNQRVTRNIMVLIVIRWSVNDFPTRNLTPILTIPWFSVLNFGSGRCYEEVIFFLIFIKNRAENGTWKTENP